MSVGVALLSRDQVEQLPGRAREVVEYRKSGLSLNHIQGCPLDCAYCIRHTYGLWDQRTPKALMTDARAVDICRQAHRIPTIEQLHEAASAVPEGRGLVVLDISDQAAIVSGLDSEQPRYYLQHALGFQVHDVRYPHSTRQHGRAGIGWKETARDD